MPVTFPQPFDLGKHKELDYFEFDSSAIPTSDTVILGYSISGDYPKYLTMKDAIISGDLADFSKNSSTSERKEDLDLSRSSKEWDSNGRYPYSSFDFLFSVKCDWLETTSIIEKDEDGEVISTKELEEYGSTAKSYKLTLIKQYDIDNGIWKRKYKYPLAKDSTPIFSRDI